MLVVGITIYATKVLRTISHTNEGSSSKIDTCKCVNRMICNAYHLSMAEDGGRRMNEIHIGKCINA